MGEAGPDDEDAGSSCAADADSWDSVAGSVIGRTGASTSSAPLSANAFPIALGKLLCVVPNRHTSRQVYKSMSRWALVLLRHDRRFQVFHPTIPRKSSHFL